MRFALDYDGTYTEAPLLWNQFIRSAAHLGHDVVCVTMRHEHEGCDIPLCKVIYTGRKAKVAFVKNLGVEIDVWIDDQPAWLFEDSR